MSQPHRNACDRSGPALPLAPHSTRIQRARWLARRCGLNATAIWERGVIERVSIGLLPTRIDLQPLEREMLATADLVAGYRLPI